MLNSRPTPEFKCPHCGKSMNHVGAVRGEIPEDLAGTFLCCIECGEVGIFTADQCLRKATPEELADAFASTLEARIDLEVFRDFIAHRRRDKMRRAAMNN